jgi:hydrogenase maturation protease
LEAGGKAVGAAEILILGIGNPLMGDDGFGVEVVRRLQGRAGLDGVEILDGGSSGLYLLPHLQGRSHIIVVDAVNFGGAAGETITLAAPQVPARINVKLSEHQVTFNEVLALMKMLEIEPQEIVVIGVQPTSNRWGESLSPEAEAAIEGTVDQVIDQVCRWQGS